MSYVFRALMSVLMNITIGIFGAVVSFIWCLYGLIVTYQANIATALVYFMFASVAACSFGMTFVVGMYLVTAGTVYVGAKLISTQYRLEAARNGNGNGGGNIRQ